jgi:hypothetical protein
VRRHLFGRVDAQTPSRILGERGTIARESGTPHDSVRFVAGEFMVVTSASYAFVKGLTVEEFLRGSHPLKPKNKTSFPSKDPNNAPKIPLRLQPLSCNHDP